MNFWERLDASIESSGKTRKALASETGITVGNIATWKTRKNYPTADVMVRIAQALGVTAEYLVTGEDSSDPWIRENMQLIRGLKGLTQEQLLTLVDTVGAMERRNIAEAKGATGA